VGIKLQGLVGALFGRLTVVAEGPGYTRPSGRSERTLICECSCGRAKEVLLSHLRTGAIRSCGCLRNEETRKRVTTHGGTAGKKAGYLYRAWTKIKSRCHIPNNKDYSIYGGRGISVYPEWINNFATFRDWVLRELGPRPAGCSLDRLDNERGYMPGNLRWATAKEQANNRRTCIKLGLNGRVQTATEWAEEYGLNPGDLHKRLKRGLTLVEALKDAQGKRGALDQQKAGEDLKAVT
jgi:hypothetical protein